MSNRTYSASRYEYPSEIKDKIFPPTAPNTYFLWPSCTRGCAVS